LRELGLPYASDPAITKHLAAFLTQAAAAMDGSSAHRRMAVADDYTDWLLSQRGTAPADVDLEF
jgi:hypothetical protein